MKGDVFSPYYGCFAEQACNIGVAPTSPFVRRLLRERGPRPSEILATGPNGRILVEDLASVDYAESIRDVFGVILQESSVKSEEPLPYLPGDGCKSLDADSFFKTGPNIHKRPGVYSRAHPSLSTIFVELDTEMLDQFRGCCRSLFEPAGLIPFFVLACSQGLKMFPSINARIDGDSLVEQQYCNMAVELVTDSSSVSPVLRGVENLGLSGVDRAISGFVELINDGRLAPTDLEGATFTIKNSAVFGTMFSIPSIPDPQVATLALHEIMDRPVVRAGSVIVRPVMLVALSYEDSLVNSVEAASFLKAVKELLEDQEWLSGSVGSE